MVMLIEFAAKSCLHPVAPANQGHYDNERYSNKKDRNGNKNPYWNQDNAKYDPYPKRGNFEFFRSRGGFSCEL